MTVLRDVTPLLSPRFNKWVLVLKYTTEDGRGLLKRALWCPKDLLWMWNASNTPAYVIADWVRDNREQFKTLGELPTVEQVGWGLLVGGGASASLLQLEDGRWCCTSDCVMAAGRLR